MNSWCIFLFRKKINMLFLAPNWKAGNNDNSSMSTPGIHCVVSKDHFPLKGTRVSWRNGCLQVQGRKSTRWASNILLQKARKPSETSRLMSQDTRTNWKGRLKHWIYTNSLVHPDTKEGENTQQLIGYLWGKNEQVFGELSPKKLH